MSTTFPTLYHRSKNGKVVQWNLWVDGNVIHTRWGQTDGEQQETAKKTKGKNVGKSNETSPEAQAVLEAQAMWNKKRDRNKYSLTLEESAQTVFLPMLANEFSKKKHRIEYPVDIQPKLDGNRCLSWLEGDRVKLMSRKGIELVIPHIAEQLKEVIAPNQVFDGEIYKHGTPLQNINKLIKKHREGPDGTLSLEYWVYDMVDLEQPDFTWKDREMNMRLSVFFAEVPNIKGVRSVPAGNEEEVYQIMDMYLKDGYEGGIVRNRTGKYEFGHRSSNLLKVKPFYTAEFEVTGFYEGVGKYEGCATFICKTKEGKEFHACPKGTIEDKKEYFKNGNSYIGRKLTVQYNNLTEDKIPQFPVGVAFREDFDLPE